MADIFADQTNRGLDEAADLTREGGGKPQTLSRRQIAEQMAKLGVSSQPAEDKGVLGNFAAGFKGSLQSQKAAFKDDAALLAVAAGADDTAANLADSAAMDRRLSEMENSGESSLEGIDSLGEFADYLGYTLGQATGYIGGAVATGFGAGKVAQFAARKVLRKTLTDRLEAVVKARGLAKAAELSASAARKAEKFGQVGGAVASSIAVNTGLISGDIYDDTGELRPGVALAGGIAAGSLDSVLPLGVLKRVGGRQAVEDVAWNILKDSPVINRYLTAAVKGFGVEGGTEAAQEIVNMYSAAYARTNGMAEAAADVASDPQFASRLVNNFVAGGIGGAAFGAGGEAMRVEPNAAFEKMKERIRFDFKMETLEQRIRDRQIELAKAREAEAAASKADADRGAGEGDYLPRPQGGLPVFEEALNEPATPGEAPPTRAPRTPVPEDEAGTMAVSGEQLSAEAQRERDARSLARNQERQALRAGQGVVVVDSQGNALPVPSASEVGPALEAMDSPKRINAAEEKARADEEARKALGIPKGVRPVVRADGRGIAVPEETTDLATKTKARWVVVTPDGKPMTVSPVTGRPVANAVFRGKDHVKPLEVAKLHGGKLFDAQSGLVLEEGEYEVPAPGKVAPRAPAEEAASAEAAPAKVTIPKPGKKGGKGGPGTPSTPVQSGPATPTAPVTPAAAAKAAAPAKPTKAAKKVDLVASVSKAVEAGKKAGIPVPNPSTALPAEARAERVVTVLRNMDLKGEKAKARDAIVAAVQADLDVATNAADIGTKVVVDPDLAEEGESAEVLAAEAEAADAEAEVEVLESEVGKDPTVTQKQVTAARLKAQKAKAKVAAARKKAAQAAPKVVAAKQAAQKAEEKVAEVEAKAEAKVAKEKVKTAKVIAQKKAEAAKAETKKALAEMKKAARAARGIPDDVQTSGPETEAGIARAKEVVEKNERRREKDARSIGQPTRDLYPGEEKADTNNPLTSQFKPKQKPEAVVPETPEKPVPLLPTPEATEARKEAFSKEGAALGRAKREAAAKLKAGKVTKHFAVARDAEGNIVSEQPFDDIKDAEARVTKGNLAKDAKGPMQGAEEAAFIEAAQAEWPGELAKRLSDLNDTIASAEAVMQEVENNYASINESVDDARKNPRWQNAIELALRAANTKDTLLSEAGEAEARREFVGQKVAEENRQRGEVRSFKVETREVPYTKKDADADIAKAQAKFDATTDAAVDAEGASGGMPDKVLDIPPPSRVSDPWASVKGTPFHIPFKVWTAARTNFPKVKQALNRAIDFSKRLAQFTKLPYLRGEEGAGFDLTGPDQYNAMVKLLEDTANYFEKKAVALEKRYAESASAKRESLAKLDENRQAIAEGKVPPHDTTDLDFGDPAVNDEYKAYRQGVAEIRAFLNQPRGKVGMVRTVRDQGGVPAGMEGKVKQVAEGRRRAGRRNRKGLAGLLKYNGRKGGVQGGRLNARVQGQVADVIADYAFDINLIEPDWFYGEFEQLRDIVENDADLVEIQRDPNEEGSIGAAFPELLDMLQKQYKVQKWKRDPKAKAAMDRKVKEAVIESLREKARAGTLRVSFSRRGSGWAVETVEGLDPRVVGLTQSAIDMFEDTAALDVPTGPVSTGRDMTPKTIGLYSRVVQDMREWLDKGAGQRIEDAEERAALRTLLDDPGRFESPERKRDQKLVDVEKAGKRKAAVVPSNIEETLPNRTYWFNISSRGAAVFYNNLSKMLRDTQTDFEAVNDLAASERDTLGSVSPETRKELNALAGKVRFAVFAQQEMMTMLQAQGIGGIEWGVTDRKEVPAFPGLGKSQREPTWTGEHQLANAYFGRGNYNSIFSYQVEFDRDHEFGQAGLTQDIEDRFNGLMYSDVPFADWAEATGIPAEDLTNSLGNIYTLAEYNAIAKQDANLPQVYDAEVMALLAGVERATNGGFAGLQHIRFFDGGPLGAHAMYSEKAKALFINLRTLGLWSSGEANVGDAAMAAHVIHELGHHNDRVTAADGTVPDFLRVEDGLVIPVGLDGGPINDEAINIYNKAVLSGVEDTPAQLFDYPLHPDFLQYLHKRFLEETGNEEAALARLHFTVASEIHAQAYTLYTMQPEWLRANMPETHAYFAGLNGGPNGQAPAGSGNRSVRGEVRASRAPVGDEAGAARNRVDNPVVRGERQAEPGVGEGGQDLQRGDPRLALRAVQTRVPPGQPPLNFADQSRVDRYITFWQDKFLPIQRAQEAVAERRGSELPQDQDVRAAEQLMHGKLALDVKRLEESFIDKLHSLMQAGDISQADLNDYLYANHAAERNAAILRRDPNNPNGSGLTQAQIDAKWARLHAKYGQPGTPGFQRLVDAAQVVYDNLAQTRQKMLDAGLIDDETLSAWEEGYDFYVPLKDIAKDERSHRPVGSSIGGRESRFAVGRYSEASAPILGQAMEDMVTKLVRIRRNEVGNSLLNLVENNPDPTLWRTADEDNMPMKRQYDARNGKVVEAPMSPLEMKMDGWFSTKVDGKTHYIWVEDEVLRRAINNMGEQELTLSAKLLVNTLGTVTRLLARLNTTYNPEFVFTNFIRDLEAGMANIIAEADLKDSRTAQKNIANGTLKDMRSALASMYRLERGTTNNSAMDQTAREFQERGGMTGWTSMKNADDYINDLSFKFDSATLNNSPTAYVLGKAKKGLKFIEDINGAVENGIRLAAYKNTRDTLIAEGYAPDVAKDKAAVMAKNLTINFNKRGEAGVVANSLYMFFNASVQGSAILVRAMAGSKTLQRAALGLAGFAMMLAIYNSAAGGEDDDGIPNYDKIPDYIKERNLIVMNSDGTYKKLPLPYGYNLIHVIGTQIGELSNGSKTAAQAGKAIASAAIDAFMPVNFAESKDFPTTVVKGITPTALAPIMETAYNEDHFGSPIFKENLGVGAPKPDSALSMRNTHPVAKAMASWMNSATGGSENQPGLVDVSPDMLEYLVGYFTGGAGRFLTRATKWASTDDPEAADTPFLRIFKGQKDKFVDSRRYFDAQLEVMQAKAQFDFLRGEDKVEFRRMNRDLLTLEPAFKAATQRIKSLRQRQMMIANSNLSAEEKLLASDAIDEEVTAVYRRTAALYDKVARR